MSAATARLHRPAELVFLAADDVTGIVEFAAPSASDPGRINVVSYDVATGETHCDCAGAEFGRACWHADHVAAAWAMQPAVREVRVLLAPKLLAFGRKARAMVDIYRARTGRALPDDVVALLAARCEYRDRAAMAAAPLAA